LLFVSFAPIPTLPQATTGCLVLARSHAVARDLSTQFRQRTVEKTYLALVRGGRKSFPETTGQIRVSVRYVDGRASLVPREQANEKDKDTATDWELVASSPHVPLSLLRLKPLTGYKHQLRIHLAQVLKTPILGDTLYSQSQPTDEIRNAVDLPDDRMFLHASQISFYRYRPAGSQKRFRIRIYAPLPPDFFGICAEGSIPVGKFERLGGLFVHRRKNHDFQYVAENEIPEVDGYWKPQPDLNHT